MDAGMTIAAIALAGVAIGVLILLGTVFQRLMKYKERQLALTADRTAEMAAQYAAQVERLEERMRVLERITTDGSVDVARQIESLREEPKSTRATPSEELN